MAMISKSCTSREKIDFFILANEKLKKFARDHKRKEIELGEARKLFSQFRLNKERIDCLLLCLEADGHIRFKRRMKRLELIWR